MRIAGESENYGTEQEHLNNVFGVHLRITALRGTSGPSIELLDYLGHEMGGHFRRTSMPMIWSTARLYWSQGTPVRPHENCHLLSRILFLPD